MTEALVGVGQGKAHAFEQLHRLTVDHVRRFAFVVVCDQDLAEEIAQEVFTQVWRQAERFDPARGTAMGWLRCITRARAIDRVRQSQAWRAHEQAYASTGAAGSDDSTWVQIERIEDGQQLGQAWRELTDRQRQALWLTYVGDLTGPQLSAHLGIPLGTAKARIRDGLIGLRRSAAFS